MMMDDPGARKLMEQVGENLELPERFSHRSTVKVMMSLVEDVSQYETLSILLSQPHK
jgi:hypothetical protein